MGNLMFLLKRDDLSGFFVRVLVLAIVLLAGLGVCLLASMYDTDRLAVIQMAFAVVLPCSVAGLFAGEFPRGSEFAILRLIGTIFTRTGLLLAFLIYARRWDLSNHGFIYYILAFYAIGLFTDVVLSSLRSWQPYTINRSSGLAAN